MIKSLTFKSKISNSKNPESKYLSKYLGLTIIPKISQRWNLNFNIRQSKKIKNTIINWQIKKTHVVSVKNEIIT